VHDQLGGAVEQDVGQPELGYPPDSDQALDFFELNDYQFEPLHLRCLFRPRLVLS
jgi:hypothetical protein